MNASHFDWGGGGQDQNHTNALFTVHRILRGKYLWVLLLMGIFGAIGGTLGYMSQKPQYRSVGMIRIQPSLPKVLYESEQSTATKMFSSFVSSQAKLITDSGVIMRALGSDDWRSVADQSQIEFVSDVQRGLVVKPERRAQEIITVAFSDENPQVSAGIVNAVMKSYHELHGKEGSISNPEILNVLKSRKSILEDERKNFDSQITLIANKYGTENLNPLMQSAQYTIQSLETQRDTFNHQIEQVLEFRNKQPDEQVELSVQEAAAIDPLVSDMVNRRVDLISARAEMMDSEGLREQHRDVRRVSAMIESLDKRIDDRMNELMTGERDSVLYDDQGKPIPSKEVLDRKIARIDSQIKTTRDKSQSLFEDNRSLQTLLTDRLAVQDSINRIVQRLEQISTESQVEHMDQVDGKISIISLPTPPRDPTSDPRIKMAGMGFIATSSLPLITVLALGFFSHRIQFSDDDVLSGGESGIIGMLPDLGNSIADKDLAAASAFAVHQIRSQLQIKNHLNEPRIYGVTSPAPQDGKTSLIIALGLSFAESGNRTLLLDLDFIGRGLSIHFGYSNTPSLAESFDEEEQLLALIHETDFEGLSILPAGFGDDERVSRLSPRSVSRLFSILRERYDTILVDTGPILGSVEAAFVSPQADGVIVVVGRGQYKPLVQKAIDQIKAVDGDIVATIFNRASIHELRQSSSSMSVHFSRQFSRQKDAIENQSNLHVGPVAGALFASKSDNSSSKTKSM